MKEKSQNTVSIIGGADGPTSVFIAGRSGKKPLKVRIRNCIYKYKQGRAEKKIVPGAHSLEEVVAYAKDNYDVMEMDGSRKQYVEQRKNLKENLVIRYKPELSGDMKELSKPDIYNKETLRKFFDQIQERSEMIAEIPDSEIRMDFHIYEIKIGDNYLEMEIDYNWNIFTVSYCGEKKAMKQLKKIARDLYIYYGVSEEDIRKRTERYSALLAILSV